eukprot:gb/GFBE01066889.1/.p1 GENE.gb/GFBE01066889.1/~~gb/GFBE01066889.1/.p1  ORF type:complete len:510 (+),score=100.91 gb/GFBE01066889.1/:1-1530(+)
MLRVKNESGELVFSQLQPQRKDKRRRAARPFCLGFAVAAVCIGANAGATFIAARGGVQNKTLLDPKRPVPARLLSRPASRDEAGASAAEDAAVQDKSAGTSKNWFDENRQFWDALEIGLSIEEDDAPEAIALTKQTEKVDAMQKEQAEVVAKKAYLRGKQDEALGEELNKLQSLVFEYWKMRIYRVLSKEEVKQGFVSFLTYGNVLFIIIFLRTVVPRLLVISSLDDFFGFANEIGVPSKATLTDVVNNLQGYDIAPKVGLYTVAFIIEKLTLISEILPVQVALKTMAPVIFGGLIPGALISASCETVGALVNFLIGRAFFTSRLKEFTLPGDPPLGEAPWFGRLEKAAEKDGLKLTLLLRLSHILPVPFDSYWYILGALPVGIFEFIAAHWVGCLKTAFLDASLGLLLLTSVVSFEGAAKSEIIVAESGGFAVVALLVQTFATSLVKDILGLDEQTGKPDKPGGSSGSSSSGSTGKSGGTDAAKTPEPASRENDAASTAARQDPNGVV